jgi:hypothetical protein
MNHEKVSSPSTATSVKEGKQKRVKFQSNLESAKCLTFPSSFTKELTIHVQEPDSARDPVVVSFPSGLPKSLAESEITGVGNEKRNEKQDSSIPVFTWTAARKATSKGRILHGNDDTCTYTAMNDGRGHDGRLTKFYIGIYHKPTNTVRFVPSAEKGTVFALNQSVSAYQDTKSIDFRSLTMNERRRMVFESFGSNKKRKVMKSKEANVVEMKRVVGAGEGMMKAIGNQLNEGVISESNKQVMETMASGSESKVSSYRFPQGWYGILWVYESSNFSLYVCVCACVCVLVCSMYL